MNASACRQSFERVSTCVSLPRKERGFYESRTQRETLFEGHSSFELVANKVRYPEELEHIKERGIQVHHLGDVISEPEQDRFMIESAAGAALVDLVKLDSRKYSAQQLAGALPN